MAWRWDTFNFDAVTGGGDREYVQPAINADPPAVIVGSRGVLTGGVQVSCLNVQAHPPVSRPPGHGGEQNLAPTLADESPQFAGVVVDPDRPDSGQCERAGNTAIADADRCFAAFGVFVAQPERVHAFAFAFGVRESDLSPLALAFLRRAERLQRFAEVYGCFLEHLLADLGAPTQPSVDLLGIAIGIHGEHPASGGAFLPPIKRVDQIET